MKFVCDKCKTRYSIGEERVRGKILKIRCKNCANVITVREGMDAADGGDSGRLAQPAASAPPAAAQRAPAALQEEWYVSIDGVQTGPLSLPDAQRWVSSKPYDAELHCWNEGFEDWLAVDKVSHFRNLRKPPEARPRPKTAPPPLPEKPLFAATMAAIEKEASGPHKAQSAQRAPAPAIPSMSRPATAGKPANGTGPVPAIPAPRGASNRFLASAATAPASSGAAALADAFSNEDAHEAMTAVSAPAFRDEVAPPVTAAPAASVQQMLESDDDDDDGLAIGEVSRVVKLADLAPRPKPANATGAQPRIGGGTGAVARLSTASLGLTGTQPKLSPTELGMNVDPALAAAVATGHGPSADESVVARSFAQRHRRGMLALIAFSALLVAGVIGVVVWVVSKNPTEVGGRLGGTKQIDTSRPEDIVRKQLPLPAAGSGSAQITQTTKPRYTGPRNTNTTTPAIVEEPGGDSLRASEVEDMAARQNEGTKRCYMRAQKGAMGFEIADIKKISVTLTVNKEGSVSDVQLSSHANNSFGQCLIARIKAWKFRASPNGGTFRISLAFSS